MTENDIERYTKLCASVRKIVETACAELHSALASGDVEQVRRSAAALCNATSAARTLSAAINELARRQ